MPIIREKQKYKPANFLNQRKSVLGFTLVELIVAISIITLILAIAIPNLRLGQRRQQLKVSAGEIVSSIREAQNMAVSGVTQNFPEESEPRVPNFGYGIYFKKEGNTDSYIIFANDGQEPNDGKFYDANDDIEIKETTVTPKASFNEDANGKLINFNIPGGFPIEVLNNNESSSAKLTEGTYTISVSVPGLEKEKAEVIINTITGKVETQTVKID